jgi:hypothetical protein
LEKRSSAQLDVEFLEVKKMINENKRDGPISKSKVGRFQISIWKKKRLLEAKNDFDLEREIETVRACVQYGRFNRATNSWDNQSIWCNPEELHDLMNALENLNGEDKEEKETFSDSNLGKVKVTKSE